MLANYIFRITRNDVRNLLFSQILSIILQVTLYNLVLNMHAYALVGKICKYIFYILNANGYFKGDRAGYNDMVQEIISTRKSMCMQLYSSF